MVVDVGVEVKSGVLQYPLREEDTMGREQHYGPQLEFTGPTEAPPVQQTIGSHGLLGRIYEVQIGESDALLAQLVEGGEDGAGTCLLIDPRDGVTWATGSAGGVSAAIILKRYNARLVLTEIK